MIGGANDGLMMVVVMNNLLLVLVSMFLWWLRTGTMVGMDNTLW